MGSMIEISEDTYEHMKAELEELREELRFLDALRAAGVDNWYGYDYALELLEEDDCA